MSGPSELRNELAGRIARALEETYGSRLPEDFRPSVSISDNLDFGDVTCSSAMELARPLRMSPRRIAEEVVSTMAGEMEGVSGVSVDGPGFINFTLSLQHLVSTAVTLADEGLMSLLPSHGKGRSALVEYVSSNPTGPLTVGHCRQAVLGESICRLLERVGWKVHREYYYNDAGRQMELLGRSLHARYSELTGGEAEVPEGGYQGKYILDWAALILDEFGPGLTWENGSGIFLERSREAAMGMIGEDLALLGIEFDRFFRESELIPEAVEETVGLLSAINIDGRSLVYPDPDGSGKLWLRLTDLGRPEDRVIIRDTGTFTYRLPDVAYHLDKFRRGFDLLVDVFGSDHIDTSRDVCTALQAILGEDRVQRELRVIIHQFVTLVSSGEQVKMSTRAGQFVTLRRLVEEVGSPDVTRYLFLTRKAEAHMDFDLDMAREQSGDNPVFYVQYAHARICGILRTAVEQGIGRLPVDADVVTLLGGEYERELMRLLESIPIRVSQAAEVLEPHRITELLAELATGFHSFYQHARVVDPEEPLLSSARLMLCRACSRCVADLLDVLGVAAPDRM